MNAEVIIVGGGIIGCAAAYNLAKNGVSVLVLEGSENIGNGGSTRNGGGVRQSGRDPRELPLVMYSIQHIWPQLSDMLDTNVEYYQEGNLRLGSTPQHQKILEVIETQDYDRIHDVITDSVNTWSTRQQVSNL